MHDSSFENNGRLAEDLVEHLCSKTFFADFTFRSPHYEKKSGLRKEAADLLVVFGNTVLALQVKSKGIPVKEGAISELTLQRLGVSIEAATDQFKALAEAFNAPGFVSFKNGRGIEVPFERQAVENVVLLVVVVPFWRSAGKQMNLRVAKTCEADGPIPLHIFSFEQFEMLLRVADTLPDFMRSLDLCWYLHREGLVPANTCPIDIWAFSEFRRERLVEVLQTREKILLEGVANCSIGKLSKLEDWERPSYVIDRMIEQLSSHAGSPFPVNSRLHEANDLVAGPNSVEAFRLVAPLLARLTRGERVHLAVCMNKRLTEAETRDISFGGVKFPNHLDGYFVFASKGPTEKRQVALLNGARAFGHRLGVHRIVSIGLDPRLNELVEVLVFDLSKQTVTEEIRRATDEMFGSPCESPVQPFFE